MKIHCCKHCKRPIIFDPEMTVHRDEGEWVTVNTGDNICEANPPQGNDVETINDPFTHEPALREYSEAELDNINRRAREVDNWGRKVGWELDWTYVKLLVALGVAAMGGYFVGAAKCLG